MPAEAKLDKVLRDLAKENAALLELVAYGKSVFPSEAQFSAEHDKFAENLCDAFSDFEATAGKPGFVITAIISDKHNLLMKGTFGSETVIDKREGGDLLEWVLDACGKKGEVGNRIGAWMQTYPYHEIHVVPYLVAKAWPRV